jgi:hypothetical protein
MERSSRNQAQPALKRPPWSYDGLTGNSYEGRSLERPFFAMEFNKGCEVWGLFASSGYRCLFQPSPNYFTSRQVYGIMLLRKSDLGISDRTSGFLKTAH